MYERGILFGNNQITFNHSSFGRPVKIEQNYLYMFVLKLREFIIGYETF